ncbi:MAG: hypothetical protein JNM93_09900 [Bacteriovoracaceae bacterium]|nr:hypothetical protein [Bacteriovoracaceae bacterium]
MSEKILIIELLFLLLATVLGQNYQKKMTTIYFIFFLVTHYWAQKTDIPNNIINIFTVISLVYLSTTVKKMKRSNNE